MGFLGMAFTSAASGLMMSAGQAPDAGPSPIERAVSHVSKLAM